MSKTAVHRLTKTGPKYKGKFMLMVGVIRKDIAVGNVAENQGGKKGEGDTDLISRFSYFSIKRGHFSFLDKKIAFFRFSKQTFLSP